MADYILLGNNTTSTTCIVYPEEFSSPHVIHTEPSLDELMENEIYSEIVEAQIQPISPTIYKKIYAKLIAIIQPMPQYQVWQSYGTP